MELLFSEQLTHFCVCVQREQPGGMRSGAVFRAGHGDPWEGFLSRAERRRRERARHRRKQGGVHQVKERKRHQKEPNMGGWCDSCTASRNLLPFRPSAC